MAVEILQQFFIQVLDYYENKSLGALCDCKVFGKALKPT